MSVSLNFGSRVNYHVDESRLQHIVNLDESKAKSLNLFDRILDFFRKEKKSDALNELYKLATSHNNDDKLAIFNRLKSFAEPAYQDKFYRAVNGREVLFFIGECNVASTHNLLEMMRLNEGAVVESMTRQENDLFFSMLDFLIKREKNVGEQGMKSRTALCKQFGKELLKLYRPDEEADDKAISLFTREFISMEEKKLLTCLQYSFLDMRAKIFDYSDQFSRVGYRTDEAGVQFTMMHPSITYLLDNYSLDYFNGLDTDLIRASCHNTLNAGYLKYNKNKVNIDAALYKLYRAHCDTLNISVDNVCKNRLIEMP